MKKILIFAFAFVAAVFASCSKNDVSEPAPVLMEKVPVVVAVNVDDTKATIKDMKWEAGDQITVWVESALETLGYKGDTLDIINPETGEFAGKIVKPQQTDTYYVAYNASSFDRESKNPVFNIPAVQNNAAEGATKAMLKGVFTGSKSEINVGMKAATAKLQINVDKAVTSVEFAGMNNEILTGSSTTISYSGAAATDIELIIPAMSFTNGYRLIFTNEENKKMYQSYGAGKEMDFTIGGKRTVNCAFNPFNISVEMVEDPMTSYSYYCKGDITKANSMESGRCEPGVAEIIIDGVSSSLFAQMGYKVKEVGYYDSSRHINGWSGDLIKGIQWNVCDNASLNLGKYTLRPFAVITDADGSNEREIVAAEPTNVYITGLPYTTSNFVNDSNWNKSGSGEFVRNQNMDVFYNSATNNEARDFYIISPDFLKIASGYGVNVCMNCGMFGPAKSTSYVVINASENITKEGEHAYDFTSCADTFRNIKYYDFQKTIKFTGSISRACIYVYYDRKGVGIYSNEPGLYCKQIRIEYASEN